jgi:hypothetical protein
MPPQHVDSLILGSGQGCKLLAWNMAQSGRCTAVAERRWIGGSCTNIARMPSKNEVWSARIAHLAHHARQFGSVTGPVKTDMAAVLRRNRDACQLALSAAARCRDRAFDNGRGLGPAFFQRCAAIERSLSGIEAADAFQKEEGHDSF